MENKTKKFSIVDLLIVILIIAMAGAVYVVLNKKIISTAPDATYNVTLEIKQMDKDIAEQIQKDKDVFDRVNNKQLGTLKDFRLTPSVSYNISSDKGKNITAKVPDRYDVELDMEISTNDDVFIGKFLSIETKDFMGAGYIINIDTDEN